MGDPAPPSWRLALEDAGRARAQVDAVNAHAIGTPLDDRVETLALKRLLGERAHAVPVSGTKSLHGHPLGASGTIEAAICALSVRHGFVPVTANLEAPDPECDLDYVADGPPASARNTSAALMPRKPKLFESNVRTGCRISGARGRGAQPV